VASDDYPLARSTPYPPASRTRPPPLPRRPGRRRRDRRPVPHGAARL